MIAFRLSMPNRGSWNGKWSGDGQLFVRCYKERLIPKAYWEKSFIYRWDDGWTACVTTYKVTPAEAKKLTKQSQGFRGYDWMITSIVRYGVIKSPKDWDTEKKALA